MVNVYADGSPFEVECKTYRRGRTTEFNEWEAYVRVGDKYKYSTMSSLASNEDLKKESIHQIKRMLDELL